MHNLEAATDSEPPHRLSRSNSDDTLTSVPEWESGRSDGRKDEETKATRKVAVSMTRSAPDFMRKWS